MLKLATEKWCNDFQVKNPKGEPADPIVTCIVSSIKAAKKQQEITQSDNLPLTSAIVIMEGKEFILYNYIMKEWHKGEAMDEIEDPFELMEKAQLGISITSGQLKVPTNAATTQIAKSYSQGSMIQAIFSGGNKHGRTLKKIKGISFRQ